MSDDTKKDAPDALPDELQAEADALLLDDLETTQTLPGGVANDDDAPQNDHETGDMVAAILGVTLNGLVAPMRGDHWKMSADECATLGHAYGAVIDKYFPNFNGGVEITAIVVTLTAFGPRLAHDMAKQDDETPAASPASDNDGE